MIPREAENELINLATQFKVLVPLKEFNTHFNFL
jgi:hypothetical protein